MANVAEIARDIDAYMLSYIRYRAGQQPKPTPSNFGVSSYEASLARKRADTTIVNLKTQKA